MRVPQLDPAAVSGVTVGTLRCDVFSDDHDRGEKGEKGSDILGDIGFAFLLFK